MQIEIINNFEKLKQLRADWDAVYNADPVANFFLSWVWLSGWFAILSDRWFVLAARSDDDSTYIAFFPLIFRKEQEENKGIYHELCMGGNSMADYTGIICIPGYEEKVIFAFSHYIEKQINWSIFHLENILDTDPRMALLINHFSGNKFERQRWRISNKDDVDNYICPYIHLPETWDDYLYNVLTLKMRRNIRRFIRTVENSDDFQIIQTTADNLDRHIEVLIRLWKLRWQDKKGDKCSQITEFLNKILRYCFANNCLYFPVLYQGDLPIGAIASWMDYEKKSILFYVTARDDRFNNPAPGIILNAYGIKYAIENGFKTYDFLRGNEPYKFSFGAKERLIKHIVIKRKVLNSQKSDCDLDPITEALQQAIQHHQSDRLAEAEQGYLQILEKQPQHLQALQHLGALMQQKEDYQSAEKYFKIALQVDRESPQTWFGLGNLYQAKFLFSEAINAYQKVLKLQPNAVAVYNNLGYTFQLQEKWEEAIASYQKALEIQPKCIEADVNLGNALYARGQLSPEKQSHYAILNYDLGVSRQKAGDLKTAILYYQQAIVMNPELVKARHHLETALQEKSV
ncbi:MAG TPA: GNAT family N-acetyltransferase [Oscillatoriales cyanobacterium M59_W2019_021]|nr:MAG: GNAT family N-acetyltransferase [Cyanobacteria bacterium J055]HIK30419.1 GNAT family N-acetyltransferase [Oscillatoriales cyanobacterium M4454_W2019_049]HIK50251.1 GNAT family N-acetyltransferase [Oscillatoriales cyanobacterium M59_W2019_021]